MTTRERVNDFLYTINAVCFDPFMFPHKFKQDGTRLNPSDGFVLEYEPEIVGKIGVYFIEGDKKTPIVVRTWNYSGMDMTMFGSYLNNKWKIFYQDLIRNILLADDCIGKLKDASTDAELNIFSFKTLANEGLKQMK